jgi:hypothetical protein
MKKMKLSTIFYFLFLPLYYLYAYLVVRVLGVGWFFSFDKFIFLKVLFFIYPFYYFEIRRNPGKIRSIDFAILAGPFCVWLFIFLFISGKSLTNLIFIDTEMVAMVSSLYLLARPISLKLGKTSFIWVVIAILIFEAINIYFVIWGVPRVGE